MTTSTTLMAAHEDEHRKATAEKIVDALLPELARTSPSVRTEAIAKVVEILEEQDVDS
jgi:hypothetical protein